MKGMEAGDGIEPSHGAFAEPGLTTWLPRRHHFKVSRYTESSLWHNGELLHPPAVARSRAYDDFSRERDACSGLLSEGSSARILSASLFAISIRSASR